MHFALLDRRLRALGSHYGALPVHAGLWEAAEATADDALARLAIVSMVLEARGLDVTPATVERFRAPGDQASARILERTYRERKSPRLTSSHLCASRMTQSAVPKKSAHEP